MIHLNVMNGVLAFTTQTISIPPTHAVIPIFTPSSCCQAAGTLHHIGKDRFLETASHPPSPAFVVNSNTSSVKSKRPFPKIVSTMSAVRTALTAVNGASDDIEKKKYVGNNSNYEHVDTNDEKGKKIIDLQTHTLRKPPSNALQSLSNACQTLTTNPIDTYDVYGDFQSNYANSGITGGFANESYLRQFEAEIARHFGKEDALFCLSGGMAQSIALLIHDTNYTKNRKNHGVGYTGDGSRGAFACHPTSHLLLHENNAFCELLGMEAVVLGSPPASGNGDEKNFDKCVEYDPEFLKSNGCYGMEPMRLSQVERLFRAMDGSSDDRLEYQTYKSYPNNKPTSGTGNIDIEQIRDISSLLLELPHREIGGKLTPWDEVLEMSRLCKERGVSFHCDGARIFEASAGYRHQSIQETAQPFTSIYISFYKGLGALSGAMLLGDTQFISEARVWLRRMGGNLYTVLPYAVSCWDGWRGICMRQSIVNGETGLIYDSGVFEARRQKMSKVIEMLNDEINELSSVVQFDPPIPETNTIHGYFRLSLDKCISVLDDVEKSTGIRVLNRVRSCCFGDHNIKHSFGCRFEWTMGESNVMIDDEYFLLGWKEFVHRIRTEGPRTK